MDLWITTQSGGHLDFDTPENSEFDFEDIIHGYAKINRYNGQNRDAEGWSDLQHVVLVSNIAQVMFPDFVERYGLMVPQAAVGHELHEIASGDQTSPFKQLLKNWGVGPQLKDLCNRFDAVFCSYLGIEYPWPDDLVKMIKRCDMIALATEKKYLLNQGRREWSPIGEEPFDGAGRLVPLPFIEQREAFILHCRSAGIQRAFEVAIHPDELKAA